MKRPNVFILVPERFVHRIRVNNTTERQESDDRIDTKIRRGSARATLKGNHCGVGKARLEIHFDMGVGLGLLARRFRSIPLGCLATSCQR